MGDSSDEEINFDDELIDLRPLWLGPSFLNDLEPDEPEVLVDPINDDNYTPRVLELTPTTSSTDSIDPFQSLLNEVTNMSRRVNNARIARQRILDLGRPLGMEDEASASTSNQQPVWTPSIATTRYSPPTQLNFDDPPQLSEDDRILYRFSQLRHLVAGVTSSPRWAHGRQTFSAVVTGGVGATSQLMDSIPSPEAEDEVFFENAQEYEHHFILPAAINERERKEEIDDTTRADRALFVSDLVLSTLTKRSSHSRIPKRIGRQPDFKKTTNNSEKNTANSISGAESEELNSYIYDEEPFEDAQSNF